MAFYPSSFGYLNPFKSRISQIWCLRHEPPQFLMVKYSFNDPNSWFFFPSVYPTWVEYPTVVGEIHHRSIGEILHNSRCFFKHFINFIQHFPAEIHQKHRFIMIYLFCSSLEKKQFRSSHVCYLNPWLSSDFCGLNSQWHPLSGAEISQIPSHWNPWYHRIRTFSVLKHPICWLNLQILFVESPHSPWLTPKKRILRAA